MMLSTLTLCSFLLLLGAGPTGSAGEYFVIEVVDAETGRGVPLVELETVHAVRYYTDSNGIVAFREPGLMDQRVFFNIRSHGYEFPKDGFGIRGKAFDVSPGGSGRIEIRRINIAERLYRLTGGGIYRDSVLAGRPVPLKNPVLAGLVFGQDSVSNAIYGGKLYWFWGDTSRPAYPLGNFHMSGATSLLPQDGGLDPEKGVDLTYFVDKNGFSKGMAPMPGDGPTWCDAFVILADEKGREKMFAAYAKVRQDMSVHDLGLAAYNDEKREFEKIASWPLDAPIRPSGHAFRRTVGGVEYIYFAAPYPLTRVRATADEYRNPSAYEAFTCLEAGSRLDDQRLDRTEDGALRYAWKKATPAAGVQDQAKLVKAGKMKPGEALLQLQDADSGKPVLAHAASVYFNPYRARWVMITCEQFGTSFLGETWFAEADTPLGPWVYARKVVTHEKYSFYNQKQHPQFAKEGGRIIFFEGTYTHTFSGNIERTPRYDYNQILYKLNLADPRLILPVPIYRLEGRDGEVSFGTARQLDASGGKGSVVFFALDRPKEGAVPVRTGAGGADPRAIFYGLPLDADPKPATAVSLYEHVSEDGARREYSTAQDPRRAGFRPAERPLCLVWRNPREPDAGWQALEPRGRTPD